MALPCLLAAQPHFSKSFYLVNDEEGDAGLSIKRFEDGYLILGGRKNGLGIESGGLAKIDSEANPEWAKTYYFDNQPSPPDFGGPDALTLRNDVNYISANTNDQKFIQLLCLDDQGDTLWTKKYDCGLYGGINIGLITTSDSNLLILSGQYTNQQKTQNKIWLLKVDLEGNVLWDKFFKPFIHHRPWGAVQELTDGSLLISYDVCEAGTFCTFRRGALTKFDKNGNEIWTRTYTQTEVAKNALVVPLDNGDIAYAWVRDTFIPASPLVPESTTIFFLDSLGIVKKKHSFDSENITDLVSLRKLSNGDLLGVGSADVFPSLSVGGWLFRMSPSGELLWERTIIDTRFDQNDEDTGLFWDATEALDGGIIATGFIHADPPTYVDIWVVKIGADGCYNGDCGNSDLYITNTETIIIDDKVFSQPNPAVDYVQVMGIDGYEPVEIIIYDIAGRIVRRDRYKSSTIDLTGLSEGLHILKLVDKKGRVIVQKIIKQ